MAVPCHSLQLLSLRSSFFSSSHSCDSRKGLRARVSSLSVDSAPGAALCVDEVRESKVTNSSSVREWKISNSLSVRELEISNSSSLASQLSQLDLGLDGETATEKEGSDSSSLDSGSSTVKNSSTTKTSISSSGAVVDRWRPGQESEAPTVPPGTPGRIRGRGDRPRTATAEEVPVVLKMLHGVEETEAGITLAMEGWDAPLSARSLVAILNALERWQKALPFFRWAQAKEYDLNVYTFNVMLKLLRNGRQWELAERLVVEMSEKGLEPDNISYSTLISCGSRCNRYSEALAWYEKMHKAGCVPDAVTYASVMDMYGRAGRVNDALALYGKLRAAGWKPDAVNFGSLLNMLTNAGRYTEAEKTFEELKQSGVKPTSVVYNIMIRVLGRMGKMDVAKKFVEEMIAAGTKPNAITVSSMVDAYGKSGQFQECLDIYNKMEQEGWGCDDIVHNSVLKQCADFGSEEQTEFIFKKMLKLGGCPTDYTYKIMLHTYARHGSKVKAQNLFAKMVTAGVPADVVSFTCLIQAYGQAKDFVKVAELYNEMVGSGLKPDEKLWGSLFSLLVVCENEDQRQLLFDIFEKGHRDLHRMLSKLVNPDTQEQQLHQELQTLTQNFTAGAYRRYVNAIIDFCESKKVEGRAMQILMLSINLGIFPEVQTKAPAVWRLHLRPFSLGVSRCLVKWWINSVSAAVDEEVELPKALMIEIGSGKGRWQQTQQRKKELVVSYLAERNSPFVEKSTTSEDSRESLSFLLASGEAVLSWLGRAESSKPLASRSA